jgi:hypothetical protein
MISAVNCMFGGSFAPRKSSFWNANRDENFANWLFNVDVCGPGAQIGIVNSDKCICRPISLAHVAHVIQPRSENIFCI